ncbi:MAG TPA: hypothetical protein VFO91_08490 [Anaerolineales bacterium]|nr:hypothetical protein [Anaerolineales bacterium]
MKNQKPIFKWITATVALLVAGLIYAVYFTELGKPISSESDHQITIYEQIAAPTLFVKWQQVPTVALAWADANQNLLKFTIIIQGLEANWDPADWVCNPYVTIDPPIPRRLSSSQMGTIYDSSGEAVQAIYEYEIDAGGYDLLTIKMDIVIGPCANYFNFQQSNVTPEDIPELVGKYQLRFQVPIRLTIPPASLSLTPASTAVVTWRDLPIFPGGIESNDTMVDQPVYRYVIEKADIETVRRFYQDEMEAAGWELLGTANPDVRGMGKNYQLWFAKDEDAVTVDVFVKDNVTHVMIRLE